MSIGVREYGEKRKSEIYNLKVAKILVSWCTPNSICSKFFIWRYKHGLLIDGEVVTPGVDDEVDEDFLYNLIYDEEYNALYYDDNWNYIG